MKEHATKPDDEQLEEGTAAASTAGAEEEAKAGVATSSAAAEEANAGVATAATTAAQEPATQAAAAGAGAETAAAAAPVKVVEFVAKSCPHCQHLEPVWKDAQAQWAAGHEKSNVTWEQKECFAEGWKPGKDIEECNRSHVRGFPTVRLYHGEQPLPEGGDAFRGPRTAAGLLKWVEEHSGSAAGKLEPKLEPKPEPSVAELEKSSNTLKQGTVQASLGPLPLMAAAALCGGPSGERRSLRQEVKRQQQAHFL